MSNIQEDDIESATPVQKLGVERIKYYMGGSTINTDNTDTNDLHGTDLSGEADAGGGAGGGSVGLRS